MGGCVRVREDAAGYGRRTSVQEGKGGCKRVKAAEPGCMSVYERDGVCRMVQDDEGW